MVRGSCMRSVPATEGTTADVAGLPHQLVITFITGHQEYFTIEGITSDEERMRRQDDHAQSPAPRHHLDPGTTWTELQLKLKNTYENLLYVVGLLQELWRPQRSDETVLQFLSRKEQLARRFAMDLTEQYALVFLAIAPRLQPPYPTTFEDLLQ